MFPGVKTPGYSQGCPSGTKQGGGRLFSQASNPILEQCLQGHFAATVSRQQDVGKDHAAVSSRKKMWDRLRLRRERVCAAPCSPSYGLRPNCRNWVWSNRIAVRSAPEPFVPMSSYEV